MIFANAILYSCIPGLLSHIPAPGLMSSVYAIRIWNCTKQFQFISSARGRLGDVQVGEEAAEVLAGVTRGPMPRSEKSGEHDEEEGALELCERQARGAGPRPSRPPSLGSPWPPVRGDGRKTATLATQGA